MAVPPTADDRLSELAAALAGRQAAYRAARGRYWQGAPTHALPPADGAKVAPDRAARPSDQAEDWDRFGVPLPAALEVGLRVDVYDGPAGQGYVAVAEVLVTGRLWRRAQNVGPEGWRSSGWVELEAGPQP